MAFTAPEEEKITPEAPVGFTAPPEDKAHSVQSLVEDTSFDPHSYALENPADIQTAREVAWQRKQKPITAEDIGNAALKVPGAAVNAVKDFGGGLGAIGADVYTQATDDTSANVERAKTQNLARAQLAEQNAGGFFNHFFGPQTFLGKELEIIGSSMALNNAYVTGRPEQITKAENLQTQTEARQADQKANPRKYFHEDFDRRVSDLRRIQELTRGQVQDDGMVAQAFSMGGLANKPTDALLSPEELSAQGAPVDPKSIEQGAMAVDPTNLLPLHVPGAGKLAGVALKAPATIARAIIPEAVEKAVTKRALHALTPAGIAATAINPGAVLSHAAPALKIGAGIAGAKIIGHIMDNAGSKLLNPEFVSATEKKAAQALLDGQKGPLSGIANLADAERYASRVAGGVAAGAVGGLPMAALTTDNPDDAARMVGAGAGFGALGGMTNYNPAKGFRPEVVNSVKEVLAENGSKKFYRNGYDNQTHAWLDSAPPEVAKQVNAYRGFFDGFKIDGKEPEINVLTGNDYVDAVKKSRGDVGAQEAASSRGFADGNKIFVNGDYGSLAGDTLGHEAGGHVAQTIMELVAPKAAHDLTQSASDGLLEKDGSASPKLREFVSAYNRAFDPTGQTREIQTTDHAMKEWLAEQARAVLEGQGPAKFAAGESVRQKIADNLGDYFHKTLGTKRAFNRQEVPAIARQYRDFLYQLGDLRGSEGATPDIVNPITENGGAQKAPENTQLSDSKSLDGGEKTPEQINATARLQSLGLEQAQVDAARDKAVSDAVSRAKTKRGRKAISDKSLQEVADQAGAEFDTQFGNYSTALENAGTPHPEGQDLTQSILLNELGNGPKSARNVPYKPLEKIGAESPERVVNEPQEGEAYPYQATTEESSALQQQGWTPEEVSAMPESQVRELTSKSLEEGVLSNLPTNEKPQSDVPALATLQAPRVSDPSPQTQGAEVPSTPSTAPIPGESEIATVLARADADGRHVALKKRTEATKAAAISEARRNALLGLLPEGGESLSRVTDPETGEVSVRGNIDPQNPVHTAILKEYGYTPEQTQTILDAQANQGKGVFLRDYNSAAQEGFETGENLDFSGDKRGKEYQASQTSEEKGKRKGEVSKQDKGFTPFSTVATKNGVNIRGFDHDKFLDNLRKVLDAADANGISTGFEKVKGKERDQALADAFRKVSENHKNGWKGDGSAPLKSVPTEPIKVNLDYIGQPVDPRQALVINMAMHNQTAKRPTEPKAKTELALAKFGQKQQGSKAAIALSDWNSGYVNPETGETNPLRDQLVKAGMDVDSQLKPTISNIRPDLIEGGISDTPTHGKSVHAHGFDITPQDLTVSGTPQPRQTEAGFMPGWNPSEYQRVLPRDLFNESKVMSMHLKLLDDLRNGRLPEGFNIRVSPISKHGVSLSEDGMLSMEGVDATYNGEPVRLEVRYNSGKENRFPFYATSESSDAWSVPVYDENGGLDSEFTDIFGGPSGVKSNLAKTPDSWEKSRNLMSQLGVIGLWEADGMLPRDFIFDLHKPEKGFKIKDGKEYSSSNLMAEYGGKKIDFFTRNGEGKLQFRFNGKEGPVFENGREMSSDFKEVLNIGNSGNFLPSNTRDLGSESQPEVAIDGNSTNESRAGGFMPWPRGTFDEFNPATESGRKLYQKGYYFSRDINDGQERIQVHKDGYPVGYIDYSKPRDDFADIGEVYVNPKDRRNGLGESLYREMAHTLQKDGVKRVGGRVLSTIPMDIRKKVFGDFDMITGGDDLLSEDQARQRLPDAPADQVRDKSNRLNVVNKIDPAAKFMPGNTDTPEFKKWFGESKAVDADGNPSVFYHATGNSFSEFKNSQLGFHFGTAEQSNQIAKKKENARVLPVFLKIKNPIVEIDRVIWDKESGSVIASLLNNRAQPLGGRVSMDNVESVLDRWPSGGIDKTGVITESDLADFFTKDPPPKRPPRDEENFRLQNKWEDDMRSWGKRVGQDKIIDFLKLKGFDGIVYRNRFEGTGSDISVAVFDPNQIKSAIGNTGAFSNESNDIRFMPDASPKSLEVTPHKIKRNGEKVIVHREKESGQFAPKPEKSNLPLANLSLSAKKDRKEPALANIR